MSEKTENFECYAVKEKGSPFKHFSYKPRPQGPNDIDIKIICCGICATDIHQVNSGWGESIYPIVPGHEIIGKVISKGKDVTKFNVGDRVGVGCQCMSCFECEQCLIHDEQYCMKNRVFTSNDKFQDGRVSYGGYSKNIRCHENFTFKIPDNLDSFKTAPLLCAGITVFEPLTRWNIREKRVGILGIGGLGHLAVKFAVAMGNEVIGFGRNPDKRDEVLALGAHEYLTINDEQKVKEFQGTFDFILSTLDKVANWNVYLSLLKIGGQMILVGIPDGPFEMPCQQFVFQRKVLSGSIIGGTKRIEEMLQFCSKHHIVADVQVYPIEEVNKAYEDFNQGKPRYRFVLQVSEDE